MEDIILIGFGGHAKSVLDTIEQLNRYHVIGYTDTEPLDDCQDYRWLGTDDVLGRYYKSGVHNVVICVGYLGYGNIRGMLYQTVKEIGFQLPIIVDPSAIVARNVTMEEGCFVGKGAILNSNVSIGKMCIINTGTIIEHDCRVGDFSHISVGSVLCGGVKIGRAAFIGANATVIQEKSIGDECIVGAGTTVRKNVADRHIVWGREKGRIRMGDRLKNHE